MQYSVVPLCKRFVKPENFKRRKLALDKIVEVEIWERRATFHGWLARHFAATTQFRWERRVRKEGEVRGF